jgi:hypothetical protein
LPTRGVTSVGRRPKANHPGTAGVRIGQEEDEHDQVHEDQCSRADRVEHGIADSKHWRPLPRWTGAREDLEEIILAIGSLVSDRAAAR